MSAICRMNLAQGTGYFIRRKVGQPTSIQSGKVGQNDGTDMLHIMYDVLNMIRSSHVPLPHVLGPQGSHASNLVTPYLPR